MHSTLILKGSFNTSDVSLHAWPLALKLISRLRRLQSTGLANGIHAAMVCENATNNSMGLLKCSRPKTPVHVPTHALELVRLAASDTIKQELQAIPLMLTKELCQHGLHSYWTSLLTITCKPQLHVRKLSGKY